MPYVTDTHSLIWHMTNNPKLSPKVKTIFQKTDNAFDTIYIPCIVFFELLYLSEKKKIEVDFKGFISIMASSRNYRIEPLCLPIIEKSSTISRKDVSDPWDRLIAGTSLHLGFPLITRDKALHKIGLRTVW